MDNRQLTIFDEMYPIYTNTKPLRVIELFAGYGSQSLALKYLGLDFEHYRICEFDQTACNSYNEIHNTNFKATNIKNISAEDLDIIKSNQFTYLLTYSFPCTDLSLAGQRKGMARGSNTRSGLLWEVERLLKECKELPQILLMENVPQVICDDFTGWQNFLQYLGYKNYLECLNSKNYGIPQTRNRAFMVSILGDYSYSFPLKIPLKLRLKDMLEDNVGKEYYLTQKQIEAITNWKSYQNPLKDIDKEKKIAPTLTARGAGENHSGMILLNEATIIGDGVYINRPHQKRGVVQKGMIQTIKTSCSDVGVVVEGNYSPSGHNAARVVMENHGTVTAISNSIKDTENYIEWQQDGYLDNECRAYKEDKIISTILTQPKNKVLLKDLTIRKITPCECFRLMGVKDEDYKKLTCSKSQKYKLAGNSIVVSVLMAIFGELFNVDWRKKIDEIYHK